MRALRDREGIPASIDLEEGRLSIVAGSTEIGSWNLADIELEPTGTGYRMAAEGDQIMIEMKNLHAFTEALSANSKPRAGKSKVSRRRSKKTKDTKSDSADQNEALPQASVATEVIEQPAPTLPAVTESKPESKTTGMARASLARIDLFLNWAEGRFGDYLPHWVFTRFMVAVGVVALSAVVIFPTLMSKILIAGAVLLILYGGVAYTDPKIATRYLPGNTTAAHVLMAGLSVLVGGVLVAIVF